jgi:hypothetical protein
MVDAAGHGWESAERVNGIEVPEHKNGLCIGRSGEVDLQVIAVFDGTVELGASADLGKLLREMSAHPVRGGLVVTGGFKSYEFADGVDEVVEARFEMVEAVNSGT